MSEKLHEAISAVLNTDSADSSLSSLSPDQLLMIQLILEIRSLKETLSGDLEALKFEVRNS